MIKSIKHRLGVNTGISIRVVMEQKNMTFNLQKAVLQWEKGLEKTRIQKVFLS